MDYDTSFLKQCLRSISHETDEAIDFLKQQLYTRFNHDAPLEIVAYRGYGNIVSSSLSGRVLAHRAPLNLDIESRWNNLQQSYRRFESDEVPHVLVEGRIGDDIYTTTSDEEGYFTFKFDTPHLFDNTTFNVFLQLPDRQTACPNSIATVYVPSPDAKFGIISDIDDTILETNATSVLQMMRLTLLESSRTRLAFSGIGELYQALHQQHNPLFYVSSSPWNLYDFLIDFMKLNNLVEGPLFLRDFGIDKNKFIAGPHLDHKLTQIRNILLTYPDLPFILIGDSGQDDPEIYASIMAEYPDQILTSYIRDVSGTARDQAVKRTIESISNSKSEMLLMNDSLAVAEHAALNMWLSPDSMRDIRKAVMAERDSV